MDETTNAPPPARTGTDDVAHVADQPPLPLMLSYDPAADEPIGYTLTARARRQVAPEALPALRVVEAVPASEGPDPGWDGPDVDLDRPGDTRPSRARALRRAGFSSRAIAAQLHVDELVVRAWIGDVGRAGSRRGSVTRVRGSDGTDVGASTATSSATAPGARLTEDDVGEHSAAFQLARAAAHEEGRSRLHDASFAAGIGLLSSILSVDDHAATLTTSRVEIGAAAVRWLVQHAGIDARQVRVVLRLGPDSAGDLARHRWAAAIGVATDRVFHARWRGAPARDAEEALIRLADPSLAATLAGWRDALLAGYEPSDAEDAAF